jgi:glycerol kinase
MKHILALDQGTTSSRAVIYNEEFAIVASANCTLPQIFPEPGHVEHDPEAIWQSVCSSANDALKRAGIKASDIHALGITNQRETIIVWQRTTGRPVHNAIVWQDRRTASRMEELRSDGLEDRIRQLTGLLPDPYFSAGKLEWILNNVPEGKKRAANGELIAGTVDSWLLYKLTGGKVHATDVSNASRTMLLNLHNGDWDPDLLGLFEIPEAMLPEVLPSAGFFGTCDATFLGAEIPITGILGDQQAALYGQRCTAPGLAKCTYGTGCFLLQFTGSTAVESKNQLLTTIAWKIGDKPLQYALEGSVFMGGAAIQWLRDGLGIIRSAPEVNELAAQVDDAGGVVLVPAFTGLGAPHWDASARGAILGLTRGTTAAHLARATLEGIAFQVAEVVAAMERDSGTAIPELRVDGGACASDFLLQIQADLLGISVARPTDIESTVRGAAMLAGHAARIASDSDSSPFENRRLFLPQIPHEERKRRFAVWHGAVERAKRWTEC